MFYRLVEVFLISAQYSGKLLNNFLLANDIDLVAETSKINNSSKRFGLKINKKKLR